MAVYTWIRRALLGAWLALTSVVMATLMAGHWYTLPAPISDDPTVRRALHALRASAAPSSETSSQDWLAVHVLYGRCSCSIRVIKHLLTSKRPTGVDEVVLFVGDDPALTAKLEERGFRVISVTRAELAREYRIEAAPLLAILSPDGDIQYLGGYTSRKQGPDFKDRAVMADLMERRRPRSLPLFGCGVSKQLQSMLDPLGIKYRE